MGREMRKFFTSNPSIHPTMRRKTIVRTPEIPLLRSNVPAPFVRNGIHPPMSFLSAPRSTVPHTNAIPVSIEIHPPIATSTVAETRSHPVRKNVRATSPNAMWKAAKIS